MAGELQRQRSQLERTHRLEAWAEMARQVAHDIKNPLTPIQLSAEHLRRVHQDRGEPLSPVLDTCVDTILTQVRLLRQIASEFSSFALVADRAAGADAGRPTCCAKSSIRTSSASAIGWRSTLDVAPDLPPVLGRSHAASRARHQHHRERAARDAGRRHADGRGAARRPAACVLSIADTGVGMDAEALGAHLRAVLLDQGERHRPRPDASRGATSS